MLQPGRNVSAANYRYGFNGKENDNDVKPGFQDYGMRVYDITGRFWSVDPLTSKYPWYSPYQFAGNKPIWAVDLDGQEDRYYTINIIKNGLGEVELQSVTEDETKAVHWYNENTTGKLGHGDLYTYRVETQDMDGKPISIVSTDVFVPKSTWLQKVVKLISSGDESVSERYGYVIYGKGQDMSWQKKFPKAGEGSESIDMGDFIDFVGGLREKASPSDLLNEGKLKDFLDRLEKAKDAVEKTNDFVEKFKEDKSKNTSNNSNNIPNPLNTTPRIEPGKPTHKTTVIRTRITPEGIILAGSDSVWGHYYSDANGNTNDTIFKKPKEK